MSKKWRNTIDSTEPQRWYFTFGFNHFDDIGTSLRDRFVMFYGTSDECRSKMVEAFGIKWSFQYTEEEFLPQIERFNLFEYFLDEENDNEFEN